MTEREARAMQVRIGLLRGWLRSGHELFDEFLRECEFDSALHLISDELVDGPQTVDSAVIAEIDRLHREMDS